MFVDKLYTVGYRNLKSESSLSFEKGLNILYGHNAAGKTNTLEAIFCFASGKSFRQSKDKDLICHGKSSAYASLSYTDLVGRHEMSFGITVGDKGVTKLMRVESTHAERISDFLGHFRAILFTPDHLSLIKGAPEQRRHLIDLTLCQIKPRYVRSLNEYAKLLSQRNAYLKDIKSGKLRLDRDYLSVTDKLLAKSGAIITKQRSIFSQKLSDYACEFYKELSGQSESLFARYISRAKLPEQIDEQQISEIFEQKYAGLLEHDLFLGRTSFGPHRDELMFFISKKPKEFDASIDLLSSDEQVLQVADSDSLCEFAARTFASQGQQRSAVLAIKLAEGEIIKSLTGEQPVFLLDDLFSELDASRTKKLTSLFGQRQCIITCCNKSSIPNFLDANYICVENGDYLKNFVEEENV